MRIALVHDDLVQWGGAERVLLALSELVPQAPIYTSVYDQSNEILREKFQGKKIITSFMQKIPGWKILYKALLPLYPIAFEQFDFSQFDLVISQTTRFAKSVITKPGTTHVCYCHTPPRFLWNFSEENTPKILKPYFDFLKNYDLVSSYRVDKWIAGSKNAQKRIKDVYGEASEVVYPFVDLERFNGLESFDGGYLLVISRLNAYKRVGLVIKAANKLKMPLRIIGVGPMEESLRKMAGPTVEFLGKLPEEVVVQVLAGCKCLVVAGEEDFGLTPLEAQALGKPVVAYRKGGSLETIISGKTGYFFDEQTVEGLLTALAALDKRGYNQISCLKQAQNFSKQKFMENLQKLINS